MHFSILLILFFKKTWNRYDEILSSDKKRRCSDFSNFDDFIWFILLAVVDCVILKVRLSSNALHVEIDFTNLRP